jgi:hypothetical protein
VRSAVQAANDRKAHGQERGVRQHDDRQPGRGRQDQQGDPGGRENGDGARPGSQVSPELAIQFAPAISAICGDGARDDAPLLICGPSGNGQGELVARAADLAGSAHIAVSAWDARGQSIQSMRAADADLSGDNPVFLVVEDVDALDASDSAILAGVLEGAGFLPGSDGRRAGPPQHRVFLLADREEEVAPILSERARTVAIGPPGAAHAEHALWLVGTERANRVGFGHPDELNVSANTWSRLADWLREGASLEDIRALLYHAIVFEDPAD